MPISEYPLKFSSDDTVLVTHNLGGSGHEEAVRAIMQAHRSTTFYDLTIVNKKFASLFNYSRKTGDSHLMRLIVSLQKIGELLAFLPVIFVITCYKLWTHRKITVILDCQPIATKAILLAARFFNWMCDKNVRVIKVLTDAPMGAEHFAYPIRMLSAKDKKLFTLYTMPLSREAGKIFGKANSAFLKNRSFLPTQALSANPTIAFLSPLQ